MAKVNEYATWKQDAIVYWEAEIDSEVESNQAGLGYSDPEKEQMRTDLKAEMNAFMDAYDSKVAAYEADDSKRKEFVGILLSVATYVMGKDLAATPEAPVTPLSTLPGDDLRNLFAWWLEDIPAFEGLFTVYIDMVSTDPENPMAPMELVYEIQTNSPYQTFLADLDTYSEEDIERFNLLVEESGNSQRDRAAYLLFAGPSAVIVRSEVDFNTVILTDYKAQEILDQFNWTIKGLND